MGQKTGPARGVMFSAAEIEAIAETPLLGDSHGSVGRYTGVLKWKGKTTNLGIFETAEACNEAYIRAKTRRELRARKPAAKGYTAADGGKGFKVSIYINKKVIYIGTYPTEKLARAAHVSAFNAHIDQLMSEIGEG